MIEVVQYETVDGKSPFADWFDDLETKAALKVQTAIARIETGNLGDHKSVGSGVYERRLTFVPGYRIYFGKDGSKLVLLLTGGTKKRQSNDIERAKSLWAEYLTRKATALKNGEDERNGINQKF